MRKIVFLVVLSVLCCFAGTGLADEKEILPFNGDFATIAQGFIDREISENYDEFFKKDLYSRALFLTALDNNLNARLGTLQVNIRDVFVNSDGDGSIGKITRNMTYASLANNFYMLYRRLGKEEYFRLIVLLGGFYDQRGYIPTYEKVFIGGTCKFCLVKGPALASMVSFDHNKKGDVCNAPPVILKLICKEYKSLEEECRGDGWSVRFWTPLKMKTLIAISRLDVAEIKEILNDFGRPGGPFQKLDKDTRFCNSVYKNKLNRR
ncbi:MAG: hypothetical protein JRC60_00315 [Deltaproteobacteria bacterium]|nr:hypothetical protein [Deltaproteobacteria bacterium]